MAVHTQIRKPKPEVGRQGPEFQLHNRIADLEKRCKEAEDQFHSVIDGTPDALLFVNRSGHINLVNKKTTELFGYSCEEILGKSVDMLLPERFRNRHRKHESNYFHSPRPRPMGIGFELYALRKDGSEFPTDISLCPCQFNGEQSVCCAIRDITERKRMEQELFNSKKLESIGILAGGIAHKFNNLLTVIMGNVFNLKPKIRNRGDLCEGIEMIESTCVEARKITQELITFSGGGSPIRKAVSLSDFLPTQVQSCENDIQSSCHISIPRNLHSAEIDNNQIGQVITHLILNADQAMETGGTIEVTAENVLVKTSPDLQIPDGSYIKINIRDEGTGIPKDILDRIFDPFFSTKNIGAGLGLTTSSSILQNHDGILVVESEVEKGSTFSFYLPAIEKEDCTEGEKTDSQATPAGIEEHPLNGR